MKRSGKFVKNDITKKVVIKRASKAFRFHMKSTIFRYIFHVNLPPSTLLYYTILF